MANTVTYTPSNPPQFQDGFNLYLQNELKKIARSSASFNALLQGGNNNPALFLNGNGAWSEAGGNIAIGNVGLLDTNGNTASFLNGTGNWAGVTVEANNVSGLGPLATQNTIDAAFVSGLGPFATVNSIPSSDVVGLNVIATAPFNGNATSFEVDSNSFIMVANNSGLGIIPFTGNGSTILLGNGAFAPVNAVASGVTSWNGETGIVTYTPYSIYNMGDASGTIPNNATFVFSGSALSAVRTWTLPSSNAVSAGTRITISSNGTAPQRLIIVPQGLDTIWIPGVSGSFSYYVIMGNYGETTFTNNGSSWMVAHNGADTTLVSGSNTVNNNAAPVATVTLPPGLWEASGTVFANASSGGTAGSSYISCQFGEFTAPYPTFQSTNEPTFAQGLVADRAISPGSLGKCQLGPYVFALTANTTMVLLGQCDLVANVNGALRINRKS